MTIAAGDRLPDATFKTITKEGPTNLTTADIFKGKTVVLFGVPGAFTKTCSVMHVPDYIEHRDALLAKGVDQIAVVAVNDHFVMNAWSEATGGKDKMLFLADNDASFAKATGLENDLSAGGLGLRFKRFSMLVKDGVVQALNVESRPGTIEETNATKILEAL